MKTLQECLINWWLSETGRTTNNGRIKGDLEAAVAAERWIHTTAGDVPLIDSKDLDAIVAVELTGDECGAGLITRTMQDRFPFVKVP